MDCPPLNGICLASEPTLSLSRMPNLSPRGLKIWTAILEICDVIKSPNRKRPVPYGAQGAQDDLFSYSHYSTDSAISISPYQPPPVRGDNPISQCRCNHISVPSIRAQDMATAAQHSQIRIFIACQFARPDVVYMTLIQRQ